MSDLQMRSPAIMAIPADWAPAKRHAPVALHTCLVVSASARRAQLWVRGAHEERWATIVCTTADDAIRQSIRQRIDLALVDLQSAKRNEEERFRKLVQQLASRD